MPTEILTFKKIDSTNTYALKNFDELKDRTVISADFQTMGRGRFNRTWVSESMENIYISFVLKPVETKYLANLTQYLSVVVAKIVEKYKVTPTIKWPNDVLVSGKKICGILCESSSKTNLTKGVVLGAGINLNMSKACLDSIDRPATALNIVLKREISKEEFLSELVQTFFEDYQEVLENGFLCFEKDYKERIDFLGQKVHVQLRDGDKKVEYTAVDIDDCGNLVVADKDSHSKTIYSGDLIL